MKKHGAIKDSTGLKVTKVIVFIIFFLYSISLIFPFVWMLLNSFKTNQEFFTNIWGFPFDKTNGVYNGLKETFKNAFVHCGENIKTAVTMKKSNSTILTMTLRSICLTLIGTFLSLTCVSTVSYTVAKYKFPGRRLIYLCAIIVMLVPSIGSTSATYKLINDLGLYDSYLSLILLYSGGFGFNFILLHGVFKSISWSYAEAAMMDGASDFKIFTKVMLPMATPTLVPLAVLSIIGLWNDYFTPYMYLKGKPTLAVGLQSMVSQMEYNANWPALFTLMIISMIPIIIIFICFQKQIMSNVTAGGLKG